MIKTIADIGINHSGQIEKALTLITLAHQAGFTYVKFQKRNPDRYPERPYNSPVFGETTYREHKRGLEFKRADYDRIDAHCRALGIEWTASPFDFESVDFLESYNPPFIKIASPVTLNLALVEYIAGKKREVVMSTGMCKLKDIRAAVDILREHLPSYKIHLLHCNSEYPTPVDHVNLMMIDWLRGRLGGIKSVGYSSHDGGVAIPVQSVAYGAKWVEVHITEDRMQPGSDHKASLEFLGMLALNSHIKAVEKAAGSCQDVIYPGEEKIRDKVKQSESDTLLTGDALAAYLEENA